MRHFFFRSTSSQLQRKPQEQKQQEPFFQQEGQGEFFNQSQQGHANDPFFSPATIQPKLTIGQPNDRYEQEADAVADQVVNGQSASPVQRKCAECAAEEEKQKEQPDIQEKTIQRKPIFESNGEGEEGRVQRKCAKCAAEDEEAVQPKAEAGGTPSTANLQSQLSARQGRGRSLLKETQSQMGSAIGADFSGVNVHTDAAATDMNQDLNAKAFTHGQDIYFNQGNYDPDSKEGQQLLAHELTHVMQQNVSDPRIQKFGSEEHRSLGDRASGGNAYDFPFALGERTRLSSMCDETPSSTTFRLTHGDIVMLSGDYFDPRDDIENAEGDMIANGDSLFRIANIPSPDPGKKVGTRDEIIYALKKINSNDSRFDRTCSVDQPDGGIWANLEFSEEVIAAVDSRYLRLAAKNDEHFANPQAGQIGSSLGSGNSAAGSYLALHEDAITRAFTAGQANQDIGDALSREAAAQHFLTDNFASGHLRTPRTSIRDFWRAKYPLFFENLKKKIALDVARYINENETNIATVFGSVSSIYDTIYEKVQSATQDVPALGFDDLVSLVAHDLDNEKGLWVTNDLGYRWKLFGDSHLDEADCANLTRGMAELAVHLGVKDIENAYTSGKSATGTVAPARIFELVKFHSVSPAIPGDKFAPFQVIPRLNPDEENGVQTWQADSLEALWDAKVRSDIEVTYGSEIEKSVKSGEIADKLEGMQDKFPESENAYWSTLEPQKAYISGFLKPLKNAPKRGLLEIIHYDPSAGQAFFNTDDAVMEEMAGMSEEDIKGFTIVQRVTRINNLIGGWVGGDEESKVVELFKTTSPENRRKVYQGVEGHLWNGNWVEGWFVSDDDIWNALSRSNLNKIKNLLNEGPRA